MTALSYVLAATGALALLVSGCATKVTVDSLAKPNASESVSYRIQSRNLLGPEDALRHKEALELVKTALAGKGMYEAPENAPADLVINLDYGVGPPQVRREIVKEPVYLKIEGDTRTEPTPIGAPQKGPSVEVQKSPTGHFGGYRDVAHTIVVYEKYLKLSAVSTKSAPEGRPPPEIWTIDVTSESTNRDLREHLPVLVAASIDYIGKDSHGQRTIKVNTLDRDITFVQGGMKLVATNGRR